MAMAAIVAGMHNHHNLHHPEQHGNLHEQHGAGQQQGSSQEPGQHKLVPNLVYGGEGDVRELRSAELRSGNGPPTARSSTIGTAP